MYAVYRRHMSTNPIIVTSSLDKAKEVARTIRGDIWNIATGEWF
jgi:hypothetical protein